MTTKTTKGLTLLGGLQATSRVVDAGRYIYKNLGFGHEYFLLDMVIANAFLYSILDHLPRSLTEDVVENDTTKITKGLTFLGGLQATLYAVDIGRYVCGSLGLGNGGVLLDLAIANAFIYSIWDHLPEGPAEHVAENNIEVTGVVD